MSLGEVIDTETTALTAESFQLNHPPALGSLVKSTADDGTTIYGIVCHVSTGGIDPSRRPIRRSTEKVSDSDVYREHPELGHTLRTEFRALLVGWQDDRLHQTIPPRPPALHYMVDQCSDEDVIAFTERIDYLRLLSGEMGAVPVEQLMIANLRFCYERRSQDGDWLRGAARELVRLMKDDYESLMTVLHAIERTAESAPRRRS